MEHQTYIFSIIEFIQRATCILLESSPINLSIHVEFESFIIQFESFCTMDLNTNFHLTLKQEMLKVKMRDMGHNG